MPNVDYEYSGAVQSNFMTPDHPHFGARDADGNGNYVPDVTYIRRKVLHQIGSGSSSRYFPLEPELMEEVCQVAPGLGKEKPEGYKILRHVQLSGPNPVPETVSMIRTPLMHMNDTSAVTIPTSPPTTNIRNVSSLKIICAIYTTEQKHDHVRAIVETWGWRCDGFFAASTKTIPDIGAVDLPHLGTETYFNMWQKTRSILAFLFDHYIDEFDYFYLAGDDTHLIVENLRHYLHQMEELEGGRDSQPWFLGLQALFVGRPYGWEPVYNLGGPGYIMNRLALQRFVIEALPTCRSDEEFSGEDMNVARCFYGLDIFPMDTADAAHRQRFFDGNPQEVAELNPTTDDSMWKEVYEYWAKDHGWRVGLDLVSTQTVSFHHLKTPVSMKRHHAIIYNSCPEETNLGNLTQSATD